jgi:hypothetical protein
MATSAEFWESSSYGPGDTNATYELLNARSPNRYHLMRLMRKRGMREYAEILSTLLGDATPASEANVLTSQLTAEADTTANVNGGVRTVAGRQAVGLTLNSDKDDASANTARNVAAADVTAMLEELHIGDDTAGHGDRHMRAPSNGSGVVSYPTDASGNGGGGKQS